MATRHRTGHGPPGPEAGPIGGPAEPFSVLRSLRNAATAVGGVKRIVGSRSIRPSRIVRWLGRSVPPGDLRPL